MHRCTIDTYNDFLYSSSAYPHYSYPTTRMHCLHSAPLDLVHGWTLHGSLGPHPDRRNESQPAK
jgi:hypothetical protein